MPSQNQLNEQLVSAREDLFFGLQFDENGRGESGARELAGELRRLPWRTGRG